MATSKITQEEAQRLLKMAKYSLVDEVEFPTQGKDVSFDLTGDTKKDIFTLSIFRGSINKFKYNIGARISKDNVLLLELHINPSNVHINPNGEKSQEVIGIFIVKSMAAARFFQLLILIVINS